MKIYLFDTLSKKKKEFIPVDDQNVRIYACGPTVYNFAHLGNARMAVVTDLLVKVLKQKYKKVTFASNITDIDDKIIEAAQEQNVPIGELTSKYHLIYNQDMESLGVSTPTFQPKATDYIIDMIKFIKILVNNKCAYESNGNILFDTHSYKYYGALSKRVMDDQKTGTRIKTVNYKRNYNDFILWKPSSKNEPGWDSPWGIGRPGWHIECSAMSKKCLGLPFDIHCGGIDLTFPHHENEIAQSCSLGNGNLKPESFCNYWFHNGFVTFDNVKMSKSLGNIKLVRDLLNKYEGRVLRLCLLSAHYKQPLDFSETSLVQFKNYLQKLDNFYNVNNLQNYEKEKILKNKYFEEFLCCLFDDINTPKALAILNEHISKARDTNVKEKNIILRSICHSLKILGIEKKYLNKFENDEKEIIKLIKQRENARKNKKFNDADQLRDKLRKMHIEIEDTPDGTKWFKTE
jgi:cysteinyl-tRNA synthetase